MYSRKLIFLTVAIFMVCLCVISGCSEKTKTTKNFDEWIKVKANSHIKGRFLFVSNRWGNWGKTVYLLIGSKLKQLGHDKMNSPVWSSDGNMIACSVRGGINIYNKEGALKTFIATPYLTSSGLSWFPDNQKIAYIGTEEPSPKIYKPRFICIYDFEKNKHTTIYEGDSEKADFIGISPSPKGDKVLFYDMGSHPKGSSPTSGSYLIDTAGKHLRYLGRHQIDPCWYPDGEHILYWAITDEEGNRYTKSGVVLFKENIETGKKERVMIIPVLPTYMKLSHDAKYIYYVGGVGAWGKAIYVMPLEGKNKGKSYQLLPVNNNVKFVSGAVSSSQDISPDWYYEGEGIE